MFDKILNPLGGNKEEKLQIAAENRQNAFAREQNTLAVGTDPNAEAMELGQQESKSDLLKWQQDLDDEQIKLIMTLKGFQKIEDKYEKVSEPMCNDTFIYEVIIPQTTPYLSRNMINTNFSEVQILEDLKNTSNDLADGMSDNFDRYQIDFKNYDLIVRMFKNTIKSGIFRAINGWNKKVDSTIYKNIEASTVANQQEEKKGMFSKLW